MSTVHTLCVLMGKWKSGVTIKSKVTHSTRVRNGPKHWVSAQLASGGVEPSVLLPPAGMERGLTAGSCRSTIALLGLLALLRLLTQTRRCCLGFSADRHRLLPVPGLHFSQSARAALRRRNRWFARQHLLPFYSVALCRFSP